MPKNQAGVTGIRQNGKCVIRSKLFDFLLFVQKWDLLHLGLMYCCTWTAYGICWSNLKQKNTIIKRIIQHSSLSTRSQVNATKLADEKSILGAL